MRRPGVILLGGVAVACASLLGTVPGEPTGGFSLDWFTIDGGGGSSAGGAFAMDGTIGQPDAGGPLTGGEFSLSGGFWAGAGGGSTGRPARLTSFTVLEGTLISGGLPRLRRSDDRYIETEARVTGEVAQPQLLVARVVAESAVQDPTDMVLTFESHITDVEGTVSLVLRNWRQGELVQVAQFAVGMEDEVQQVTVPRARRFIRASDGRIKLQIKKIVFFPFTLGGFHSLIDHVEILVR